MNKNFDNKFKFKVIVELMKGDLTVAEIISKYKISRSVIHKWKKLFFANGSTIFGREKQNNLPEQEVKKLHEIIGKLKVENDFLQDAWQKLKD
jgi:transposase